MLKFACPRCRNVVAAAESSAGTVAACPHCRQPFRVPGAKAPVAAQAHSPRLSVPPDVPRDALRMLLRQALETRPGTPDARSAVRECVRAIDRRLSDQLREILHHPDFRRLEATWRGLHYLVSNTETSPRLRIRVLNVSKHELARDFLRADSFDLSALFQKVSEPYARPDGEPFGLLIGDYEFGRDAEDVALFESIARVAAAVQAPFVAAAAPAMFGLERFAELAGPRDLAVQFQGDEYAAWRAFRELDIARDAALTVPRVQARLPYGAGCQRVTAFEFEEDPGGSDSARRLWMSAAWAYAVCVTDAFARHGWLARTRGVDGGGKVEGLPVAAVPTDEGAVAAACTTEIALTDRREFDLSYLGFLPLVHCKGWDFAVFMSTQSCQKPKPSMDPNANTYAELSAKLNFLLCGARFAHYLGVLVRQWLAAAETVSECERWLNEWIGAYVIDPSVYSPEEEMARRPLVTAHVEVRDSADRTGRYELIMTVTPHFQLEYLVVPIRLALDISP